MMNPSQPQANDKLTLRGSMNIALFACRACATSVEVFLHRDIGDRYLGVNAAVVFLIVPVYLSGWQGYDCQPMLLFLLAYLGMCCAARAAAVSRRLRGESGHSRYTGWPRFLGPKAKITELRMKQAWEPAITFFFGWALREEFNAPLGTYLMICGVCLYISVSTSIAIERMQALDLNDAVLRQEMVSERFREMRRDRS